MASSPAPDSLLSGLRVLDLCGEPAASAGRILADLGATVVRVLADPHPDTVAVLGGGDLWRAAAWTAGTPVEGGADRLDEQLATAAVVVDTPGWPGTHHVDPARAPQAVWISITPFGQSGPRARWRATDLGVLSATGNLWCTGDPDRAPVRCTEPVVYAHTGPEAVVAALTALAGGRTPRVDLSMQETVLVADMGGPGRFLREGERGQRRGAAIGATREIWPCRDGWISFGIRGGRARVGTWRHVADLAAADGIDVTAIRDRDWAAFNHNNADPTELDAIADVVGAWFARHTMTELYGWACEHNLTLAPINSPREILASEQLAARDFFGPIGGIDHTPRPFLRVRDRDGRLRAVGPTAPEAGPPDGSSWGAPGGRESAPPTGERAWSGTTILEFGSGAAGPIATRYFAEHGATVVRIESTSRPDFLRSYALGPDNPHGLDGAPIFDALNPGKLSITLDLKSDAGRDLALRLIDRADAVAENFAPKAMAGLGLDYDTLCERRPDLVMLSACLNGQTGPHRDYPGFGGQGAALAGFNFLTGWPDREPVGPYGTITDSLAPRFAAAALAAALLHRRRTGRGCHLDLSQVEAGTWALSPWLIRYSATGEITGRVGNRHPGAVPHGAFPTVGDDRWIAIAAWSDDEWAGLTEVLGLEAPGLETLAARIDQVDAVEAMVAGATVSHDGPALAEQLQSMGIEAVAVQDFGDCSADPQLAHRGHFQTLTHPRLGDGHYERNGFRLSEGDGQYDRPSPLLGEHTRTVLHDLLGLDETEIDALEAAGVLR